MERLKAARFVNNFSRALPEPEVKSAIAPIVESQLPTNANIGNLGTSNAVLGDSDGPYLHITMTSLGNAALLDALSVVSVQFHVQRWWHSQVALPGYSRMAAQSSSLISCITLKSHEFLLAMGTGCHPGTACRACTG